MVETLRSPRRAVPLLALLALTLRLWGLGARAMHFDEARVGYWTLRYLDTGYFAYRPVVHGPFLSIATAPLLDLFGASEFTVRLLPAVLGGLLPLAAFGFRAALDDDETVALAAFLAVSPVLVFFSRFFREDLPLAAFAFAAVAAAYRGYTDGRPWLLVAAGVLWGLALTTKENVVVYAACVLGAVGVALAVRWRIDGRSGARAALARARPLLPAVPVAAVAALAVAWVFYAPRGYSPGFDDLLATPVAAVAAGTVSAWTTFAGSLWVGGHSHPYAPYLLHLLATVAVGAPALYACALAGVGRELRGFVRGDAARPLVVAAGAWGLVSLAGYPYATDIKAPWLAVHAAVPLAVPAAVGAVAVGRRIRAWNADRVAGRDGAADSAGRDADPAGRRTDGRVSPGFRVAVAVLVVALVAAQTGFVLLATSYTEPTPRVNLLAQGAQPGDDLDPLVADVEAAAGDGGVLYYGSFFRLPNETVAAVPPRDAGPWLGLWLRRLPLTWYVERAGATHRHAAGVESVPANPPPVVFAAPAEADEVAGALDGYRRREYDLALYGNPVVVFTDEAALHGDDASTETARSLPTHTTSTPRSRPGVSPQPPESAV
ncbi:flippase activity-associated protein Agl23 [Halobaculum sp. P14]|uniref:flippase activity-associated protein Agl23 n=1 Tax=Halobaculum sp. P14 TaxID=3421638 RepID=UPI003EBD160D